jgi:hypothetical protein
MLILVGFMQFSADAYICGVILYKMPNISRRNSDEYLATKALLDEWQICIELYRQMPAEQVLALTELYQSLKRQIVKLNQDLQKSFDLSEKSQSYAKIDAQLIRNINSLLAVFAASTTDKPLANDDIEISLAEIREISISRQLTLKDKIVAQAKGKVKFIGTSYHLKPIADDMAEADTSSANFVRNVWADLESRGLLGKDPAEIVADSYTAKAKSNVKYVEDIIAALKKLESNPEPNSNVAQLLETCTKILENQHQWRAEVKNDEAIVGELAALFRLEIRDLKSWGRYVPASEKAEYESLKAAAISGYDSLLKNLSSKQADLNYLLALHRTLMQIYNIIFKKQQLPVAVDSLSVMLQFHSIMQEAYTNPGVAKEALPNDFALAANSTANRFYKSLNPADKKVKDELILSLKDNGILAKNDKQLQLIANAKALANSEDQSKVEIAIATVKKLEEIMQRGTDAKVDKLHILLRGFLAQVKSYREQTIDKEFKSRAHTKLGKRTPKQVTAQ